ncbi:uncharacterized protein [Dasypus novemcinctus]|uniref:uncharacterized protein n=1 Tax=Dasypus novemcinctus TaxID=9361 RepID=UPI00265F18FF|nr:uncharacterized protein LOC131275537 [Dasypus novemcinctus]
MGAEWPRLPARSGGARQGEPAPPPGPKVATLLRKIRPIRLHHRDTEDPSTRTTTALAAAAARRARRCAARAAGRAAATSSRGRPPGATRARALPGGAGGPGGGGGRQHCTQVRSRRLRKELQDIWRLSDRVISVELVDGGFFDCNVKLHQVDKDSVLWQDMKETNTELILLNLTLPFSPPLVRVLGPRLENGCVLDGGAICRELTPRGWSSACTVEAVLRQFTPAWWRARYN